MGPSNRLSSTACRNPPKRSGLIGTNDGGVAGLPAGAKATNPRPTRRRAGRYLIQRCYRQRFDIHRSLADSKGMVRVYGCILMIVWAFCGVPTLCVAGLLKHACAPEAACGASNGHCQADGANDSEHRHSHEPADDGCPQANCLEPEVQEPPLSDGCHHESGCSSDPCAAGVVRPERPRDQVLLPGSCVYALTCLQITTNHKAAESRPCVPGVCFGPPAFLRFASDLPLII